MTRAARPPALGILTSRIGRRFVGLFAACALVPLVVFAVVVVHRTTDQMRSERTSAMHNAAKTAGMGLASRLNQIAGDLELIRTNLRAGDGSWDAATLARLQGHVGPRCEAVWTVRDRIATPWLGQPPAGLPELTEHERAHIDSGRVLVRAIGQGPGLLALQAIDPADRAAGLLAASIRGSWFWDRAEMQTGGYGIGVFTPDWRPLFHTFGDGIDPRPFARAAAAQPSSGTVEWAVGGEPHVARYWRLFLRPHYDLDLFVVQSHPTVAAFAVLREFTFVFVATAIATLLLVVVIGLVQVRRTLQPIVSLHEATTRLSAGDLGARVVASSRDELGELAQAFNAMAQSLQDNIRRREQTERELMASRDAALAAARAKAEFVTNVSHEFRTPMTELLSATEILGQFGDGDEAAREEFAAIALRGARRLARLIDEVVELGAGEAWRAEPVAIAATLREAVASLPAPVQARVRVTAEGSDPIVTGDAARLRETWCRLLDNAAKFSADDAPIDVRVAAPTDGEVVVEVQDRGVGIASTDLARIFEPFEQVGRDQLTDKAHGTGLGLTLAKNAVERHGGRIEVESEPGRGSTFRVVLPAAVGASVAGA
jgi:signal transduction histidine kinase